ncbi:uncharacterized protein LOC135469187 [Liolophura sinensis]|uniref:uncharacterized protein LOC135469187 n=1 Tax=Liolophura sinensis TaxID=3198878 RepID=UPI003157FC4D
MDCRGGLVFCLLFFTAEGKLIAQKLCPDGKLPLSCFANPCEVNSCPAYPLAECRANYCGGCSAEYYVEGQRVDCSVCRNGDPPEKCDNQCKYARPAPGYKCVAEYCCGCSIKFVELCAKECLIHPCARTVCESGLRCQPNFCDCSAQCVTLTKG